MSEKVNIKTVVVFAGSYVATIIGSGFATGQEITQFFAFYGMSGLISVAISMVLFCFMGVEFLNRGRLVKPIDTMKIFSLYTGKVLGKFFEYFVPFFLFGVFVVMISGAGATISEYYGLSPYLGRVLMAVLSLITVSFGLKNLANVIGNIGPVIIVFTILVGAISLFNNFDNLPVAIEFVKNAEIAKPAPNAVVSGILYASYNVVVLVGILVGLGATTDNKKEAVLGGLFGGIALMLAGGMMYLAIFAQANVVFDKAIPTLFLADQISPVIGKLFSIILLLGIFSTAAPLLWMCANRFCEDENPKFKMVTLIIAVVGLLGGLLPFGKLVGTIYPYTGYIGIFLMIAIVYKMFKLKSEGKTGLEEMQIIEAKKSVEA